VTSRFCGSEATEFLAGLILAEAENLAAARRVRLGVGRSSSDQGPASAPAATERVHEMTDYVFAYSGGRGVAADEAERNAQMAKWGQWFGELGSAVVDGGAATGTAKTVGPDGSVSDGGSRGLTGYSIVSADSLDSAVELAKGCPVLEIGGAVDVYEAITM
jgi:hypothetical protein